MIEAALTPGLARVLLLKELEIVWTWLLKNEPARKTFYVLPLAFLS